MIKEITLRSKLLYKIWDLTWSCYKLTLEEKWHSLPMYLETLVFDIPCSRQIEILIIHMFCGMILWQNSNNAFIQLISRCVKSTLVLEVLRDKHKVHTIIACKKGVWKWSFGEVQVPKEIDTWYGLVGLNINC